MWSAVTDGKIEIVRLLLDKGANVDAVWVTRSLLLFIEKAIVAITHGYDTLMLSIDLEAWSDVICSFKKKICLL